VNTLLVIIGAVLIVILLLAGAVVCRTRVVARCADRADQIARAAHVRLDLRVGLDPSPARGRHRLPTEQQVRRLARVRPVGGSAAAAVVAAGFVVLLVAHDPPSDATPSQPVAPAVPPPASGVSPTGMVRVAPAVAERTVTTVRPPPETVTLVVPPPPPSEPPPQPSSTSAAPVKPARSAPKPRERCQLKALIVCLDLPR
jgi:hypothetical protein